ncbi:MAG: serine protease Do [Verrucomicrobiales bacterium]|jgi:serine protease Do
MNIPTSHLKNLLTAAAFLIAAILPSTGSAITNDDLKKTESQIRDLCEKSIPCTVSLIPGGDAPRFGSGSGVVVSEDGLILTAAHVAMEMGEKVTVIFSNGDRAEAEVLGMDFARDAAMIQITSGGKFPFVDIGESEDLGENEWCIALGHASGFQADRSPPVRLGRVIENNLEGFVTTDCTLIGGDSGGPLFDLDSKVIGIHSNISFSLSQNNHVPIAIFKENWDQLKAGVRIGGNREGDFIADPERPMIGASLDNAPGGGARIVQCMPDSPAEKAGLESGDVILQVNKKDVEDTDQLIDQIRTFRPGDSLTLQIRSGDEDKEVEIKLATANRLGLGEEALPGPRNRNRPPGSGPRIEPDSDIENPAKKRLGPEKKDEPKEKKPKDEDEPKAEEKEDEETSAKEPADLQAEFNKLMRDSLESGDFKFNPNDLERFGGVEGFGGLMEKFESELSPGDMIRLMRLVELGRPEIRPEDFDPKAELNVGEGFFRDVLNAFRPSTAAASESTLLVFRGTEWKSLGTVVHENGYVITKASEIETENNQKLTVMVSKDNLIPAEVVKQFPEHDLALLRLKNSPKLTPIVWGEGNQQLPLGSLLAASGSGPDAIAIGVVSVLSRTLSGGRKGFLGIVTAPAENGVRIAEVLRQGNAGQAGLQAGDVIVKVDRTETNTPEKLIKAIGATEPGAEVEIHFLRDGKKESKTVKLVDRSSVDAMAGDRAGHMNDYGTEVSKERTGFPNALQTDLPIRPQQCGGPLVDLNGKVIGINIARAGRIRSYALPAKDVLELLEPELKKIEAEKKQPKEDRKKGKKKGKGKGKVLAESE